MTMTAFCGGFATTATKIRGGLLARINIEECWWSDPRRSKLIKLIGNEDIADAQAVRMWRVAQEFWGRGRTLVPLKVWATLEAGPKLLEANLAEQREDGIYVCGSSQYLDWVLEKREAGRAGGRKSADARRKKYGSAQPAIEAEPKQIRSKAKHAEPSGSGSGSDSGSSSDSGNENPSDSKPQAFIAAYCRCFKERWGMNPQIQPKDAGIAGRLAKGMSFDRYEYLLGAFFKIPDAQIVKWKHPISAFEMKLNEITVFADSGNFTTQRQAQHADDAAAVGDQLRRIREGKL